MGKFVISVKDVVNDVCDVCDVTPQQLFGPSRVCYIMAARKQVYRRLYFDTGLTLRLIAKLFGRDHSSVSRAIRSNGH